MKRQKKLAAASAPLVKQGLTPHAYLEIFMRRKWWFITVLLLGTAVSAGYSYTLPPMYRSSTLLLIAPQKVPIGYVSPTVMVSPDENLRTLLLLLTSRTNLAKLIHEFGLYKPAEKLPRPQGSFVEQLTATLAGVLAKVSPGAKPPTTTSSADVVAEEIIERMRQDIEIQESGQEAFSVAYVGNDPHTVMRVTNALALFFIKEQLQGRERQAERAAEFLQKQLEEIERDLQQQEGTLRNFQQTYRGQVSTRLDTNRRTLEKLQNDFNTLESALRSADSSLMDMRDKIFEAHKKPQEMAPAGLAVHDPAVTVAASPVLASQTSTPHSAAQQKLELLQQELARLRMTFHENYPDIAIVKQQIAELSQAAEPITGTTTVRPPAASIPPPLPPTSTAAGNAAAVQMVRKAPGVLQNLEGAKGKLEHEIVTLQDRRKKIAEQIVDYQKRLEVIPTNEKKLTDLTRGYNVTQQNYQTLLEKRLHAGSSEDVEKKQQGEALKIVEPAYLPTTPYKPNRPLIIAVGGLGSSGIGVGLILLGYFLSPALRKPEDFLGISDLPVLVTMPRHTLPHKKRRDLITMQAPDSMAAERYRLLYTKLNDISQASGHKIFAVSSAVQSEGKTVTVLNLAVVMARDFGKRTLVIEGECRRPTIPLYMDGKLEEGLVDILSSKINLQSTLVPLANTLVPLAHEYLSILPAVKRTRNSSSLLHSQRVKDLLCVLRERYDFILIDAPPILARSDMNAFAAVVDGILLVVRAGRTPRGAFLKALDALETDKVVGIVLNDVRPTFSSHDQDQDGYPYTYGHKAAVG